MAHAIAERLRAWREKRCLQRTVSKPPQTDDASSASHVDDGPLASGAAAADEHGPHALPERAPQRARRKSVRFTGFSAGAPAVARHQIAGEAFERDNISGLIGPLATAEALAVDDYNPRTSRLRRSAWRPDEDHDKRKQGKPAGLPRDSISAHARTRWAATRRRELKYKRACVIARTNRIWLRIECGSSACSRRGGKVVPQHGPPNLSWFRPPLTSAPVIHDGPDRSPTAPQGRNCDTRARRSATSRNVTTTTLANER